MSAATDLARDMRAAAETLRRCNRVYNFQPEYGVWNPVDLLKEAAVVEVCDDTEIEGEAQ